MILAGANGKYITHARGPSDLNFTLARTAGRLEKGEYILMVDVNWHQSAIIKEEYRKVAIQIYTLPGKFDINKETNVPKFDEIKENEGMEVIKKAVAGYAEG